MKASKPADGGTNLHPRLLYKSRSSVSSDGDHSFTNARFSQCKLPVVSWDYRNNVFKGSDCVPNDVVEGDVCSLNPSLTQAVNTHKGKISGLKHGNGNISSGEYSLSLAFNQSNDQPVIQEETVHLSFLKNTVTADRDSVDSKVVIGGAGLQDHNESDDMGDFDIDDFSENDIPDYCEPPMASSLSGSSSAPLRSLCEGQLSNSCDKKFVSSAAVPHTAPTPAKPCFPG